MKRKLTVAVSAAIIVLGLALIPGRADARHGAGAFFGGLAAGAILGGVLAAPYAYPAPYYGPVYYGAPYPYGCYPPYYSGRCFHRVRTLWNGFGWYRQRVLICR
jgi:hypothetical protein